MAVGTREATPAPSPNNSSSAQSGFTPPQVRLQVTVSPRRCHSTAPGVSQPSVPPPTPRDPPRPPPSSQGCWGLEQEGCMGGMVLTHVPRATPTPSPSPGQVWVGKLRHSGPPTPPSPRPSPRPARRDAGGREGAGRELALTASPAGATGPAPRGSGQWDETGSTQSDAHPRVGVWHPERAGSTSRSHNETSDPFPY